MPKLDGYEAVNVLKASDKNRDATIVVITATDLDKVDRSRLPEHSPCMQKPINVDVLKQFVRYESQIKTA
jgi:CheY-like chemotaxis protein